MTHEQASYSPGLNSIEGQKFCPCTETRSRDKLPSLSLGISKAREMHNYCTPHIIKENLFSIHRCNYTPRQSFRIALYMFCGCVVQQLRPLNTLLIFLKASKQRYLLLEWTFYADGKQMGGKIYDRPSSSILCFLNGHDYTHIG